jgi:hypothetical protein
MTEFEFQLVDTQGMTDADDVKDVLRALIDDAHNVFLAVVPATHPSTSTDQAIKLLSEHGDAATRTITVLTKLDTVESINLIPNVQQRLLGPAPEGDSRLTASTPVRGLINSNRLGQQLDAAEWCEAQLLRNDLTDPLVKDRIGVRSVLEAIEQLQFKHVTEQVLPRYSRRLQKLKGQKSNTLRELLTLCSTMMSNDIQGRLLRELNSLVATAPAAVRGELGRGIVDFNGFQRPSLAAHSSFPNIRMCRMKHHNDTAAYEELVGSLAAGVFAVTAQVVHRAVRSSFNSAELPGVVTAVEQHLVALANQMVQPVLDAAREEIMKLPRASADITSCDGRINSHIQAISSAIEQPAVTAVERAVLQLFDYVSNAGAFSYWCNENLAETFDEDKPDIVAERLKLDAVLDQCNAAIATIHSMMGSTSSSFGNSSGGSGFAGFSFGSSSGGGGSSSGGTVPFSFSSSSSGGGGGSSSGLMRAPAVSVKREYEDRERKSVYSSSAGGSSSKRSRKASSFAVPAAPASAPASPQVAAAAAAPPAPRADDSMLD